MIYSSALKELVEHGLLHFDEKNKKFDLHPIVRGFAYNHLTASQRTDTHRILVVYFETVPKTEKVEKLEDLAPVIELYHHMVRAGNLDKARELFYDLIWKTLFYRFGGYQLQIELLHALFLDGEEKPPCLEKEDAQGWTLNELANAYALSGQPRKAIRAFQDAVLLVEKKWYQARCCQWGWETWLDGN